MVGADDELLNALHELARARVRTHEVLAEGLRALSHSQDTLTHTEQLILKLTGAGLSLPAPNETRRHRPAIVQWRSYEGFRADMIRREQEARRHSEPPITKKMLADQVGSDSVRTISRVMGDYRLDAERDWPPSSWPEQQPSFNVPQGVVVMAAGVFAFGLLDVLSDGRLDGVVRIAHLFCHLMSGQF